MRPFSCGPGHGDLLDMLVSADACDDSKVSEVVRLLVERAVESVVRLLVFFCLFHHRRRRSKSRRCRAPNRSGSREATRCVEPPSTFSISSSFSSTGSFASVCFSVF